MTAGRGLLIAGFGLDVAAAALAVAGALSRSNWFPEATAIAVGGALALVGVTSLPLRHPVPPPTPAELLATSDPCLQDGGTRATIHPDSAAAAGWVASPFPPLAALRIHPCHLGRAGDRLVLTDAGNVQSAAIAQPHDVLLHRLNLGPAADGHQRRTLARRRPTHDDLHDFALAVHLALRLTAHAGDTP